MRDFDNDPDRKRETPNKAPAEEPGCTMYTGALQLDYKLLRGASGVTHP